MQSIPMRARAGEDWVPSPAALPTPACSSPSLGLLQHRAGFYPSSLPLVPPSHFLLPQFPLDALRLHAQISTLSPLLNLHPVCHVWPWAGSTSLARNLLETHPLGRASPPVYEPRLCLLLLSPQHLSHHLNTINYSIVSESPISSLESLNRAPAIAPPFPAPSKQPIDGPRELAGPSLLRHS